MPERKQSRRFEVQPVVARAYTGDEIRELYEELSYLPHEDYERTLKDYLKTDDYPVKRKDFAACIDIIIRKAYKQNRSLEDLDQLIILNGNHGELPMIVFTQIVNIRRNYIPGTAKYQGTSKDW